MRKILKLFMTFVFACCLFVGVNPAEAGLISREQEIEMGQQTAKQLEAQYGVSQDAALQERVNRIGQRLAKVCGRDDITFSFKVLDLTERRMGAKLVPDYLENVTTPDQYEILEMNRISGFVDRARGLGRPTKKDRRELEQFTDLGMMNDGFDFEFDFEDPEDEE